MNAKTTNIIRWIHIVTGLLLFVAFILVNQLQMENLRPLAGNPHDFNCRYRHDPPYSIRTRAMAQLQTETGPETDTQRAQLSTMPRLHKTADDRAE